MLDLPGPDGTDFCRIKKCGLGSGQLCFDASVRAMHLPDVHGCIGEIGGAGNRKATLDLLWRRVAKVLDVAARGVNVVGAEVRSLGNIRIGRLAVIALVVVVGQDFPVVLSLQLPGVVELVILKVVGSQPLLLLDTVKVVGPGNFRLRTSIQVHPDKSILVNMDMEGQKAVRGLVESREILISRRLGELAVEAVRPPVVFARQDAVVALLLGNNGEGPVSADVVECVDGPGAIFSDDKFKASHLIS